MDDSKIIDLYWQRDEKAIEETDSKYGAYCRAVSMNILGVREDAEECVSDTYARVWNAMPPERPGRLLVWLAGITRNLSIDRWRRERTHGRGSTVTVLLSELEECVSSPRGLEEITDARELGRILNGWLKSLPRQDCADFMRRYWGSESVADIAAKRSATAWATSSTTGAITPRACICTALGIPAGS